MQKRHYIISTTDHRYMDCTIVHITTKHNTPHRMYYCIVY